MLEIPEKVRPMVSDYKMNLLQLRASKPCDFQDPEVRYKKPHTPVQSGSVLCF